MARAHEILNSKELKQSICNQILGTTFKDIERAMGGIIRERQLTPSQQEEIDLREIAPEKFEEPDLSLEFKVNQSAASPKKSYGYRPYTREEVAQLLAASKAPYEQSELIEKREYSTYSREEIEVLMTEYFAHKERSLKLKEE